MIYLVNALSRVRHKTTDQSQKYGTVSCPLFVDVDTKIYPPATPQHHARLKAKRADVKHGVHTFQGSRKQTRVSQMIIMGTP